MTSKVFYSKKATEQIKKLDKAIRVQILDKIEKLPSNPEMGKPLGNVFKNKRSLHVGKYRVVYSITEKEIIVARIAHRGKVYR